MLTRYNVSVAQYMSIHLLFTWYCDCVVGLIILALLLPAGRRVGELGPRQPANTARLTL